MRYTKESFEATIVGFLNGIHSQELESLARREAFNWYDHSNTFANNVAVSFGLTLHQAAGIIAAFSIRTRWDNNVADVTQFLETGAVKGLKLRANKSRDILESSGTAEEVSRILNGPKTQRFARNIAGDLHSVTIDVWMCRLLGLEHKHAKGKVYDIAEDAVRSVAQTVGMEPAVFQAYLWILVRGEAY